MNTESEVWAHERTAVARRRARLEAQASAERIEAAYRVALWALFALSIIGGMIAAAHA